MPEPISFKEYPILFVDDEPLALVTYQNVFKGDFTIYTALDGDEALKVIAAHPEIALVASDQRMPKMDGLQLLAIISSEYPKIIKILVTAYSNFSLITEAVNNGSLYRCIEKPYDERELRAVLIEGIAQYRLATGRNSGHSAVLK